MGKPSITSSNSVAEENLYICDPHSCQRELFSPFPRMFSKRFHDFPVRCNLRCVSLPHVFFDQTITDCHFHARRMRMTSTVLAI